MPYIQRLPNALILFITQFLDSSSLSSFIRTCRRFHQIGTPGLYKVPDAEKVQIFKWALRKSEKRTVAYLAQLIRDIPIAKGKLRAEALTAACAASSKDAVAKLLEGTNPCITEDAEAGKAAIIEAAKGRRRDDAAAIVRSLLTNGANPHATDLRGKTALHYAAQRGNRLAISHLVYDGAEVHKRSKTGMTPILSAAAAGSYTGVEAMIMEGADVNDEDEEGDSVLIKAANFPEASLVRFLLEMRANKDHVNGAGRAALSFAAEKGDVRAVEILVNAGCRVKNRDAEGKEALDYCSTHRNGAEIGRIISARASRPGLR
ncbi:ankyrin repeat-containing domain protein [Aspergillus unguis]